MPGGISYHYCTDDRQTNTLSEHNNANANDEHVIPGSIIHSTETEADEEKRLQLKGSSVFRGHRDR